MTEFHGLWAESQLMKRVFDRIRTFAPAREPVIITGESGTGKEGLARALHAESGRPGSFVAINCGGLVAALAESELFGHVRGAFTGAVDARRGAFGAAEGGTLLLDELGELPLDLQPKLLRVLETSAVRPVGGEREVAVDVRIVCATHRPLAALVQRGVFRRDLFHRLAVLPIDVPPLRSRPEDIPELARRFVGPNVVLESEALEQLVRCPWLGNVRELRNTMVRSRLLATGGRIAATDLRPAESGDLGLPGLASTALDAERARIAEALDQTGGNRARAARILGLPRSTLHDRLRRLGGPVRTIRSEPW